MVTTTSEASDVDPDTDINDLQVIDAMLFHEFAVVDRLIVKVTPWLSPERPPHLEGRYQGLVKRMNGNMIIEDFYWDGFSWRNIRTGRFTKQQFHWRGLSSDPQDE